MGIVNPYLAQNSSARFEGRECLIVAPSRDSPAVVYINIYPVCKTRRAALETANAHRASFGSIQVAMPTSRDQSSKPGILRVADHTPGAMQPQ